MENMDIYVGKKINIKSEEQFRKFMFYWQNIIRIQNQQKQKNNQEKQLNGN